MGGVGKRWTGRDGGNFGKGGRKPGAKNKWRKAELDKMREHIQRVLNRQEGGIEAFLGKMVRSPKGGWAPFMALLRDMTPKPALKVEADATVTVRWQDEAPVAEPSTDQPQAEEPDEGETDGTETA